MDCPAAEPLKGPAAYSVLVSLRVRRRTPPVSSMPSFFSSSSLQPSRRLLNTAGKTIRSTDWV